MGASPVLRVELLGGFRVLLDGRAAARLPSARQQEILAFLVLHARGAPVPRQRVAASLWPESTDAQALTNLRRELHHLRDNWPKLDVLIDAGSRTLTWAGAANAAVDVVAFTSAAERALAGNRGALDEAARLYGGDLLPDCTAEWIESEREGLRQRAAAVLTRLVAQLEEERAFGDAIERAQQLLRLDSLNEDAWGALMRSHARRGDRATALHLYQQCAALFRKELGIQPGAATRMTYRDILDLDAETPISPAPARGAIYPLVGRDAEWRALLGAWQAAAAGSPRLLLIRGEAGIGKSRLAEELTDWCRLHGVTAIATRCYPGEGRLAYAPIAAWLKTDAIKPTLMKLDAPWLTDVARLRPELLSTRPEVVAPVGPLEAWQRLRFFDALVHAFQSAAPIVLVLDDLQWTDAETVEWLQYFLRSASGTASLVVGTVRAEEEQDNAPLGHLLSDLQHDDLLTTIVLGRLDAAASARLAGEVAEQALDETALARTFRETEGHPLFIIERGRMQSTRQTAGSSDTVMPRVQSVVAARLALLSGEARQAAEIAAAVGRDFRFDILAAASDLEEDSLVRALDELWRRQIVRVQGEEGWDFTHDRIREVAYSGIGPARRRLVHRRIAQAMELLFADRQDEVGATIAMHLERGGQPARAIPFLERAAAVATRVLASEEAARCLTQALSLLAALPAGRERDEKELALRSTLSVALNSARGYAALEVEENLNRVFALSGGGSLGQMPVRWLWVAFTLRYMLGDLKGTREIAEQALTRSVRDPSCRCEAHHVMGAVLSSIGMLEPGRHHFEASLNAYDERHPQRSALGSDLGVFGHAWYSHTLWLLGDEEAAVARVERAIVLAQRLDDKYSQTIAFAYAALLHQMRRDVTRVLECARMATTLCDRYGFAYYGDWARALAGWAHGHEQPAEGIQQIESALARLDAQRAQARRPYYLSLLAETLSRAGDRDRARATLDAAIAMALERDDAWWLPAMYLQKSDLEPSPVREALRRQALELARAQDSRSLEQRILAPAWSA